MPKSGVTLALLQTIADANGTDIDAFRKPGRREDRGVGAQGSEKHRRAAMLPRFFRAYFALPGRESRLQALRMMEAMAARAKGVGSAQPR